MQTTILGGGRLGRAIEAAILENGGPPPRVVGRPLGGRHTSTDLAGSDVVVDASRGDAVRANLDPVLESGCRRILIATTGWDAERAAIDAVAREARATAVAAPNLSLGAAVFLRIVEHASALLGRIDGFDPYILEWHRRGKVDRPSGTAREIGRRLVGAEDVEIAVIRAGASPGMHQVGWDSQAETIELRLTARDRSAYGAGAVVAIDWLRQQPRQPGIHAFDAVVDDLLRHPLAATA